VDESNEIKKALKICGGNWNGIAFENMLAIYRTCLRELPCSQNHLSLEIQADLGIGERKTNEKLKILLHKRILIRGTDNLVLWYTQNNNGREMK